MVNDWQAQAAADARLCTYQLHIVVARPCVVGVGRLGVFRFIPGDYVYTGSARKNLSARVRRHLSAEKRLRWHIDYLLNAAEVSIADVILSDEPECRLNQRLRGEIVVPGFGASDCRAGCASHLKLLQR